MNLREDSKTRRNSKSVGGGILMLFAVMSEAPPQFVDATAAAGIDFVHTTGASGQKYMIETMGAGAAFIDYDSDGDLDIFIVDSNTLPGYKSDKTPSHRLYRNNGDGTFSDSTQKAGVSGSGYGMGVAIGDYDNDGWDDIYVTNWGPGILYRNNGNGTFRDVTRTGGRRSRGLGDQLRLCRLRRRRRPGPFHRQLCRFQAGTEQEVRPGAPRRAGILHAGSL